MVCGDCCSSYGRAAPWGRRGKGPRTLSIACGRDGRWGYFAPGRGTFVEIQKYPKNLRGFGPGPQGASYKKACLTSGAHSLVLRPRLPGLRPWVRENRIGTAAESCTWVSQLCGVVLGRTGLSIACSLIQQKTAPVGPAEHRLAGQ